MRRCISIMEGALALRASSTNLRLTQPLPRFCRYLSLRISSHDPSIYFNIKEIPPYKMSNKAPIPDAWDDDWESQADKADAEPEPTKVEDVKISKKQRLAMHAETNKKLWESAYAPQFHLLVCLTDIPERESPEAPFFLAARDTVPLKQEFKPALKVLSRKPAAEIDPLTGLAKLVLEDDEEVKKDVPSPEELRLRAQKEREEKMRKYNERRAELLPDLGNKPTGTVTPPNEDGRQNRGKGRGGARQQEGRRPENQSGSKELFDPNYTPKPGVMIQKRNGDSSRSGRSTPKEEEDIIRKPRGPPTDGSAGFGFGRQTS
jgi:hypothetical protein